MLGVQMPKLFLPKMYSVQAISEQCIDNFQYVTLSMADRGVVFQSAVVVKIVQNVTDMARFLFFFFSCMFPVTIMHMLQLSSLEQ